MGVHTSLTFPYCLTGESSESDFQDIAGDAGGGRDSSKSSFPTYMSRSIFLSRKDCLESHPKGTHSIHHGNRSAIKI